ncbi:hypothetical protein, partial [Shewanella baltica]|uniref:hypothetical protein n=1 Tax=Shewanella baltica TaxID=62322 RepID=UPI0039B0EBA6
MASNADLYSCSFFIDGLVVILLPYGVYWLPTVFSTAIIRQAWCLSRALNSQQLRSVHQLMSGLYALPSSFLSGLYSSDKSFTKGLPLILP